MTHNTPVKIVLLAAAFAGLAACASAPPEQGPSKVATTETQQWMDKIKVTSAPDEIVLASHATGLSANQGSALEALVGRWLDAEGRELVVTAPNSAGAMATQIRDRLITLGAPGARVRVVGFNPAGPEDNTIRVGFLRYEAQPLKCGERWENLAATRNNTAYENFGCAMAANIAAQVANPEDLIRPRDTTPIDAGRRDTVLGKYRKGETTSAAKDDQASGAISKAIQ
ncbi:MULTISPECIES: CpaD family pilus assembly lipoprotein [unclassified Caulobacter]|jgi:pilus assembly protein CpaD|uniref:CpaD family pilus assembly lipoprotein n=1 Tax=unclassified Caulobacter TaxID=2648921 RepID=UPI0006FA7DFF|nr:MULTISPECIES: CpaD family pilus assembly lipoprotein [unclassified Caulobacter]KQV55992.1 pilus assembly protein CpaD [Caulobacter sp. Root342]KQV70834.1 pilus assembly protein CpaD [Caulobacter sp. Root343]